MTKKNKPKDPVKEALDTRRAAMGAMAARGVEKALYVMVPDDRKRVYEEAAKAAGMTMRDYVITALDAQVAQQEIEVERQPDGTTLVTSTVPTSPAKQLGVAIPQLSQLMLRVGTLEKQMESLLRTLGPAGDRLDHIENELVVSSRDPKYHVTFWQPRKSG